MGAVKHIEEIYQSPLRVVHKQTHFFDVQRDKQKQVCRFLRLNNTPYKFNGKELDEETGYYYYGARYYNPRTSIWLSVDPLAEQTMTPYQYVSQNPINLIDPTGMSGENAVDWYRGVRNGKEEVKWLDTYEEAEEYFDEGSKLDNLGDNFMSIGSFSSPQIFSENYLKLTPEQEDQVRLQQLDYIHALVRSIKEISGMNDEMTRNGFYHMELGGWSGTEMDSYYHYLAFEGVEDLFYDVKSAPEYASQSTFEEYNDKYGGTIVGGSIRFTFFTALGQLSSKATILSWFLNGPQVGPNINAVKDAKYEGIKSMNKFYNYHLRPVLVMPNSRAKLKKIMKSKTVPTITTFNQ